jgi:hypothetical protein
MDTGKSYTNFEYQKKYSITSSSDPLLSYVFTNKDIAEGRDIRLEVPTDMGMMEVVLYNVTPNTTTGGIVPIRIIDGRNYTGPNPITGELSYIFFINDSLINYTSYNIKLPFNRSRMSQPNKFLRCLDFDWATSICTRWNVSDITSITDPGSNYTFTEKKQSLKCSPALADTAMHGSQYYEMYGGMSNSFDKLFFDDFEFGYNNWFAQSNVSAYPYPSDSYSGSSAAGYSLKVEYLGGASTAAKTSCQSWEVQQLCAPYGGSSNITDCSSGWYTDNGQDDAARAEANNSFAGSCSVCCGGNGTFVPYSSSPYREPWNSTQTPYRYHAFGECICTGSTGGATPGYVAKSVNYNTKQYKYISFSYKVPSASKFDMQVMADSVWYTYNGTASQGQFNLPGFKADGAWHTVSISLDRDLDNTTQCASPCNHQVTQIKFGSDSGAAGQRFFIDDVTITNEMGAAAKNFYEADFEKSYQVSEWSSGQIGYNGYFSPYSLKVINGAIVTKPFGYFSQDYRYIDFVYKTTFGDSQTFKLRIMSYKVQNGYYTNWNMTEIIINGTFGNWTKKHMDLNSYSLNDTRIERIEFANAPSDVYIDNFLISSEVPGECTNCNIIYAGVTFNTKYFSDFEYGASGWIPAGGSNLSVVTTNTTSYSGMGSLILSNSTYNLVANFTPGFSAPSITVSQYPYMSFAYKASIGTMKFKLNKTWYNIPGFTADNLWHTITLNLTNYSADSITEIAIGNNQTTYGATFYLDDFIISSNHPDNCPYVNMRHDISFNMRTAAGWKIDAGSGEAKPDVFIDSVSYNNTSAMVHNGFILVNVTVGNQGNASTGGGQDSIQVDCYWDNTLVSTNYTDVLGPHPPKNVSWTYCNFTARAGCHTFNITTKILDPPDKEEWNYTNNNESYTICVNRAPMPIFLAINGSQTNKTYDYTAATNVTGWKAISEGNLTLYRNDSAVGSQQIQIPNETIKLAAGLYNYTLVFPQSENYTDNSTTLWLTISKVSPSIQLLLNNSADNYTYTYEQYTNATGYFVNGDASATLTLYRNGSSVATGTHAENVTMLGNGTYNYTYVYTESQNYSTAGVTRWAFVNKKTINLYLAVNGSQENLTTTYPYDINVTAWKDSTINNQGTQTLAENGTDVGSLSKNFRPAARAYNYTTILSAANYSALSVTRFVTINKGSQITTLQLNGTSADKIYIINQTAELKAFSNNSATTTSIYTNFTGTLLLITSGTGTVINTTNTSDLPAGNYTILANSTFNENYSTSASVSYTMTLKGLELNITVEAGGPYATGSTIVVIGNASDVTGVPVQLPLLVQIRDSGGVVQASSTPTSSADGGFTSTFTGLSAGGYSANVSYGSTEAADPFTINASAACAQQTITISGIARDFTRGTPVSSGTVYLTIKETEDKKEVDIINGYWSASFTTCLNSGTKYTLGIRTRDLSNGKSSYSQTQFIAP